jgi:hypothetical protein
LQVKFLAPKANSDPNPPYPNQPKTYPRERLDKRSSLAYTQGRSNNHHHRTRAQIAQLVEQRIENPRVAGSIPALGTIFSEINSKI